MQVKSKLFCVGETRGHARRATSREMFARSRLRGNVCAKKAGSAVTPADIAPLAKGRAHPKSDAIFESRRDVDTSFPAEMSDKKGGLKGGEAPFVKKCKPACRDGKHEAICPNVEYCKTCEASVVPNCVFCGKMPWYCHQQTCEEREKEPTCGCDLNAIAAPMMAKTAVKQADETE